MMRRTPSRADRRYGAHPATGSHPIRPARSGFAALPAVVLGLFGAVAVVLFAGIMLTFASYTSGLPDPGQLEHFELSEASRVISADGVELATFAAEQRRVMPFASIPQVMIDAQVAAEDRTFWTNPCIDFRSILRAALQNFSESRTVSGASTICQQLVRIRLFDSDLVNSGERRWERKIKEAILALRVGERYPGRQGKEKLLEMYLNQVYYGNSAYGIWAAASRYFGKDLTSAAPQDQLTVAEAALLAALVRAPSSLDPTLVAITSTDGAGNTALIVPADSPAIRAQHSVLEGMLAIGAISAAQRDAALAQTIVLAPPQPLQYLAPHFVYAVRRAAAEILGGEDLLDRGGLVITTTLDYNGYQTAAEKWANVAYDVDRLTDAELTAKYGKSSLAWLKKLQGRNVNNDALVTLNYRTGAVLAYVGSANFYGEATPQHQPAYDVVGQAYRQSGSAIKPITYVTGFDEGTLTPATMLMDVKSEVVPGFAVADFDRVERGPLRVRDALKYSLNIPAVKAQQLIGTDNVVAMAERLGLRWDPQQAKEVAVPSLTLGTIGVHMLDLVGAYGAIANGGLLTDTHVIERIVDRRGNVIYDHATDAPDPSRALSAAAAYLVTDILADNTDPKQNALWGANFQIKTPDGRRPAALKTGTTNDSRDLQAFGFVPADPDPAVTDGAIVTAVWIGNSDFSPISRVFASTGPANIWREYMTEVTAGLPLRDFQQAAGVVEAKVDPFSGQLAGPFTTRPLTEIFLAGHLPQATDALHRQLVIEAVSGKIWQPGCGDPAGPISSGSPLPGPSATPAPAGSAGQLYLDLAGWEAAHPSWEAANLAWIERNRGKESSLRRFPLAPLDAPLAPTQLCTPGEIPTSTPLPSPTPVDSATPEPTLIPTPTPTPGPTP